MTGTKCGWSTLKHPPTSSPLQILEKECYGRTKQGGTTEKGPRKGGHGKGAWKWGCGNGKHGKECDKTLVTAIRYP